MQKNEEVKEIDSKKKSNAKMKNDTSLGDKMQGLKTIDDVRHNKVLTLVQTRIAKEPKKKEKARIDMSNY